MRFLKFVVFIWTLHALAQDSDALTCSEGQKVAGTKGNICEPCTPRYFQDVPNRSKQCKPCRKCDTEKGSKEIQQCSLFKNTVCGCQDGFIPQEKDSSTCQCPEGSVNKFKDCIKKETSQPKATTSNKIPHLLTFLTSPRPQKGTTTQKPHNATTTNSHPGFKTKTEMSSRNSHTSIIVGLIFLMCGLLVLTALICKQNMLSHMKTRPGQKRDPSFRTPVEESGDGSQDSLKQNQEEL